MMWNDRFQFLSKLTFSKIVNAVGLVSQYIWSKWTKNTKNSYLPVALAVEPTTSCNLRCPECPSGLRSFTRPTGMIDLNIFKNIIDQMKDTLMYLTFYFQGEPYLHKDFLKMVKMASENNIYTSTSTNAHYLTPQLAKETVASGLDKIIISIDGTTQDTYEQYRVGGSLNKVIEGTKNLIAAKKDASSNTPHVIFQFLVVKPNQHQINDVLKLKNELGVNELRLKTAQIYDFEDGSDLIPSIDKYSRYEKTSENKYKIKSKFINHCWKMWHSAVITWDGLVVPCCFDKDAEYRMGDLKTQTFDEVWNGTAYSDFKNQLVASRKNIGMCNNCTEGTKIWG